MVTAMSNGNTVKQPPYYPAVSGDLDYFGAAGVIADELRDIRLRGNLAEGIQTKDLCGLALSGGGIRSASFSLGVMQALAHNGWLSHMAYLSTVSGGGYIGSSLTWAVNSFPSNFGISRDTFPFASFPMSSQAKDDKEQTRLADRLGSNDKVKWRGRLLNFIRQNATYLTPGHGLNFFTLIWVALRGAGLGLLVYGALITLLFAGAIGLGWFQPSEYLDFLPKTLRQNSFLAWSSFGLALFLVSIPLYSLATFCYHWVSRDTGYPFRRLYEICTGYLLPMLLTVLVLGLIPLTHDWLSAQGQAEKALPGEITVSGKLNKAGVLSIRGILDAKEPQAAKPAPPPAAQAPADDQQSPWKILWDNLRARFSALSAGIATIILGAISGIMAFLRSKNLKPGNFVLGVLVSLGIVSLLFGILLFAYTTASAALMTIGQYPQALAAFSIFTPLITLGLALLTNLNHISIHRYYRDRLMETFMPDIGHVLDGKYDQATSSTTANRSPLHEMTHGPYHIINTNVVLASSRHPKFHVRGGDNFILSPLACGSYATGWQPTSSYLNGTMTLASAMAISGAAINPSAGCGGEGITRSPFLSVLMGLLNFRLGCWVPNPKNYSGVLSFLRNPDFLYPGLYEVLLRFCLNEKRAFLQLSDGGHFENLGLYELVRRKLKLIIVCDGGADPNFAFSDLSGAMEKVRTDFGALIMLNKEDLDLLIPPAANNGSEPCCAKQAYLAATIKYADGTLGTLIYLTTTFFTGLSADLYGYKKEHPAFPDEPTGDQFFSEKQFEAYRELGFQAAWKMMGDDVVCQRAWPDGRPGRA